MTRPLRTEYPGAWYYVMNRGRRRELTFLDDADFRGFYRSPEGNLQEKEGFREEGIRKMEEKS